MPPAPAAPVHRHHRRPKRRRAWIVGAVAVVAVLGAVTGFLVASASGPTAPPPQPTGLVALKETDTSVTLGWKAQASGPQPGTYEILRSSKEIASVPGQQTSYQVTGLNVHTGYAFSVVAVTGTTHSAQSVVLFVSTADPPPPPLAAAAFHFIGFVNYQETASSDDYWHPVGDIFQDGWTVDSCGEKVCDKASLSGSVGGVPFTATLNRTGATYTGSAPINNFWFVCSSTSEHAPSTLSIKVTAIKETYYAGDKDYVITGFSGTATWVVPFDGCSASRYQMKITTASAVYG